MDALPLTGRVVRGGAWMAAISATGWLLGGLRLIVLARLLSPVDFGTVGIALIVLALVDSFSATGTYLAIITQPRSNPALLNTAWTVGLLRGAFITAAVEWFAPQVAFFFHTPEAVGVIRVMALMPLLRALTNIGFVEFRRELSFRPQYLYQILGIVAELAVAVPLAWWLRNAWALVAGWLGGTLARVLLSYWCHPYRPRLQWDGAQLKTLSRYGRWVFGSTALRWCLTAGVEGVVGRLFGVGILGAYHMAGRLSQLPVAEATHVVGHVTLPAYARLKDAPERVRGGYLRVLKLVCVLVIPAMMGLVLIGRELLHVLLGPRWDAAAPLAQILAVGSVFRAALSTVPPLVQGIGRPKLETMTLLWELALLGAGLAVLARQPSAEGMAWVVTSVTALVTLATLALLHRELALDAGSAVRAAGVPFAGTLLWWPLRWWVGPPTSASAVAAFILACAALYAAWLWAVERSRLYSWRDVLPAAFLRPVKA